mmetsp:Transcript_4530/g.6917  ORF Transcript_4530/g.6917 Transcript_4530/m.6917 type:complete len:338 (+) Transcript_4530:205-1218(+)
MEKQEQEKPSTPFLAVPIGKHLYGGRSYLEMLQLAILEVFLPWWWVFQSPFGNPNRGGHYFLLWDTKIWNPFLHVGRHNSSWSPWWGRGLLWILYLLGFPYRIFIFLLLTIIKPILYAPYYLLMRELVYLPRKRRTLRRIARDGRRVVGRIAVEELSTTYHSGNKGIVFLAPGRASDNDDTTSSSSSLCEYKYEFCNSESEIRDLLGREGRDAIAIGEEFQLIVLPYESNISAWWGSNPKLYYEVWTDKMLAGEWAVKCTDYPRTRPIFLAVVGALTFAIVFQNYGNIRLAFCSEAACTFRDIVLSSFNILMLNWGVLYGLSCNFDPPLSCSGAESC